MVYLGVAPGSHSSIFMHGPNNTVFTVPHALFDKGIFPRCPDSCRSPESTRLCRSITEQQVPDPNAYLPGSDDDDIPHRPSTLPKRRQELDCDDDQEPKTLPHEVTLPPRTPSPQNDTPVVPPPALPR